MSFCKDVDTFLVAMLPYFRADKEQGTDPWGNKMASGNSTNSEKAFDSWERSPNASGQQNVTWNNARVGGSEDGDGWNDSSVKITGSTARGVSSAGRRIILS